MKNAESRTRDLRPPNWVTNPVHRYLCLCGITYALLSRLSFQVSNLTRWSCSSVTIDNSVSYRGS